MTRGFAVAAIALAIASAAACGKGAGAPKPVAEREVEPVTNVRQKLSITISLPKGIKTTYDATTELQWKESAVDTLFVIVRVLTPFAMQNELNDAASHEMRVSRSDQLPDGWSVTAASSDGTQTRNRRLVKVTDNQAVECETLVVWDAKSKKNNEWVESFCKSLTVKPQ